VREEDAVNDRFSRRTLIAGAAGVAASLAVPVVATADDEIRIPDSSAGIAERLGAVANGLGQVGARLDRIDAVLINPPDPDKPPIRDALTTIRGEAEGIVVSADDMLRRV
jgi:hypothetical protein